MSSDAVRLGEEPVALELAEERYAVCRLDPAAAVPQWAFAGAFWSVTRSRDELSLVVEEERVPRAVTATRGWRRLAVRGPIPFSVVGLLAALATALAAAGVSLFPLATHDTDHLLVRDEDLGAALAALRRAGCHLVTR